MGVLKKIMKVLYKLEATEKEKAHLSHVMYFLYNRIIRRVYYTHGGEIERGDPWETLKKLYKIMKKYGNCHLWLCESKVENPWDINKAPIFRDGPQLKEITRKEVYTHYPPGRA